MSYNLKMMGGYTLLYKPEKDTVSVSAKSTTFTVPKIYINMTASGTVFFDGYDNTIKLLRRVDRDSLDNVTIHVSGTEPSETFTIIGIPATTFNTNKFFNSENPTTRSVYVSLVRIPNGIDYGNVAALWVSSGGTVQHIANKAGEPDVNKTIINLSVALYAPPQVTSTSVSYTNTREHYVGRTIATITVNNPTAQYGGNISSVECSIGDQTISQWSITNNVYTGTLALNQSGTFNPTIKITDSRGQISTYTKASITVLPYAPPTTSFSVSRIASNSLTEEDDGTRVLVTATFDYAAGLGDFPQPTVKIMKAGETVKYDANITWYTDSACTTAVNWSNYNPDSGVTLYGIITGYSSFTSIDSNYSYGVYITPKDAQSSGSEVSQIVPSAFYTIDFLAGGKGIAFGAPALSEGFWCNMDTFIGIPQSSTAGTTDKELYDAIVKLGWQNDVIV